MLRLAKKIKRRVVECLPFPYCLGKEFVGFYRFLEQSQWWNRERIEEWQFKRFKLVLNHTYEFFPLYGNKMRAKGIHPNDIQSLNDTKSLPIMNKMDLLSVPEEEQHAKNTCGNTTIVTMGGTTGSPLKLLVSKRLLTVVEQAFVWRHQSWAGLKYGQKIAVLRGTIITEDARAIAPMRLSGNTLYLSTWHISPQNLHLYYEALKSFKPAAIRAYPSSLLTLTRYLSLNNRPPIMSVKVLITSSESIPHFIRKEMEKYWQVPITDYYGLGEHTAKMFQCEFGRYHIQEEYAYVELIPDDRKGLNRIIGTNLHNFATPLIRYDPGDYCSSTIESCKCGRTLRSVETVQGRPIGRIVTRDRRIIGLVTQGIVRDSPGIHMCQLYQDDPNKLLIRIVKHDRYTEDDWKKLLHQVRVHVGEDIDVEREFVDDIKLTPAGKRLELIQKLDVDSFL